MKLTARIRETLGGYLGRHEARMVSRPGVRMFSNVAAGVLDVAGFVLLIFSVFSMDGGGEEVAVTAMIITGILTVAPVFAGVAVMIPAMSGEKQDGTLEALMLAPVSRRELLWAKLLGRMAAVRRFMWTSLPAWLFCWVAVSVRMAEGVVGSNSGGLETATAVLFFVVLGALLAVVMWVAVVIDAHCAGAMALYCSARAGNPVKASLLAYGAVFVPSVAMSCCYGAGLPYHFVAGPIMFSELVRNLDRFTIERE